MWTSRLGELPGESRLEVIFLASHTGLFARPQRTFKYVHSSIPTRASLVLRHAEMETCLNLIQFGFTSQATIESIFLGPKGVGGPGFLSLRAKMISK